MSTRDYVEGLIALILIFAFLTGIAHVLKPVKWSSVQAAVVPAVITLVFGIAGLMPDHCSYCQKYGCECSPEEVARRREYSSRGSVFDAYDPNIYYPSKGHPWHGAERHTDSRSSTRVETYDGRTGQWDHTRTDWRD